ncbi:eukaryotic porin/Tom40 [Apiospora marii]|uniref:Eukaryotic porin/Tom40 n=1 Tax=Apiospora marii TaxID=335849 RepID=A0ABR1S718_9PEZI
MSVPAYADIAKSANDLLNKDFYHLSAGTIEIKSNTPNNVAFKVTGKSSHEKATSGVMEAKWADKARGNSTSPSSSAESTDLDVTREKQKPPDGRRKRPRRQPGTTLSASVSRIAVPGPRAWPINFAILLSDSYPTQLLTIIRLSGLTMTQTWNTVNALETKIEAADVLAKGVKAELMHGFLPTNSSRSAKLNLHFKQSAFHGRAFFDLLKGPTANIDAVVGHDGFLAGASAGYDVQKAALTGYSAAVGYTAPSYSAAITASDNLSIFAASYYHKVNGQVEAGAKATWNSKSGNNVGLEVASKYRLDPLSFAKAKINDRGVAAISYNCLLRPGVNFGLGGSFDTQKLDQATHKVGVSFTFEG